MKEPKIRPMHPDDWETVPIEPGRYSNAEPLTGFRRRDGLGGNDLHPVYGDEAFEADLLSAHASLRLRYPGVKVSRHVVGMPRWAGQRLPEPEDYPFVDAPESLSTTSVTVLAIPNKQIQEASMRFRFRGQSLPSLRQTLRGVRFRGIAGNLGYYMTAALIQGKPWAHNARFPGFPLPKIRSYIGFHLSRDERTGEIHGSFEGAHPAVLGVRSDGSIDILPQLGVTGYGVTMGGQEIVVDAIDDPDAVRRDVVLFTPAWRTAQVRTHIAAAEASVGRADGWKTYAPRIPLADVDRRVNVFVANEGNGQVPVEKAIAVWEGPAPVPSFGAVLSIERRRFESLFTDVETFRDRVLGQRVQIVPYGKTPFRDYMRMLGGFVPVVVDGEHVYCVDTVGDMMSNLSRYGNANSPIAQAGRETRNFDPRVREPAGVLIQTDDEICWVLFDGRHELSIGVSVADVAVILGKMQREGILSAIRQAVFVDGGSAMKAYHIVSDERNVDLEPLNRVAAGSRNGPGADTDGLNMYSLLMLRLVGESEGEHSSVGARSISGRA